MCGIGGILRTDGQPIPEAWLDAIDARIAYRGPDGHGRFRDRVEVADPNAPGGKRIVEVAFVHRRLSIIDHKDGAQPMVSERGRNEREGLVAVVFNGCIYNHRELRKELEAKGHTFVTDHSDTEVLIHGWREWGECLADHLEGMYAFAIWDRTIGWLALARDVFGEKPLYYSVAFASVARGFTTCFAFASETSSLERLSPGTSYAVENVSEYVRLGYCTSEPPWGKSGIDFSHVVRAVSPAESLAATIHSDLVPMDADPLGYGFDGPDADRAAFDHADFERLLNQAVLRRLEADVPLGCFLSGGIDSSLIAVFAKKGKSDLRTFTVRMSDQRYDESRHAEEVARLLSIEHATLDADPQPAKDLVHLIELLGQPFGDSSILPTYWVSKAAREHVKVSLSGDGGDELFVGYERYLAARVLAKYRRVLARVPRSLVGLGHPKTLLNKIGRLGDMARDFSKLGVSAMQSIFSLDEMRELVGAEPTTPRFKEEDEDALVALRDLDEATYLPDDLLRKVDTASMACGLEVRCPFLDRDLARAARSIPIDKLMPGGQRKGLLRQIARKYLPREIVDRPKMGFAIPIGEWFRNDDLPHKRSGMKTLLLDHLNSAEPFGPIHLNRKAVQRFIDEHMSGKRDHGQRLFTLLTLSIWAKQAHKRTNT